MQDLLRHHSFSALLLLALSGGLFFYTDDEFKLFELSGFTMGTSYNIQLVEVPDGLSQEEIALQVLEMLEELDKQIFSTYAANSELSRLNRHEVNIPFTASREMIEVLSLAIEVGQLSNGAFDVTVGALVNLWGFGPIINGNFDSVPEQKALDKALRRVGYQFIEIDKANSEIVKLSEISIDLSGIAKGYAVDELAAYFDGMSVDDYFLEIGGELKIKGYKPGEISWVPAIETPLVTDSQVYEVFYTKGESIAVAGSGNYRNYFENGGVRYSHEIDPRTGKPISHDLAAAYVIDGSAARADALATAFMILGLEQSIELAMRENLAAYFIFDDGGNGFSASVTAEFNHFLEAPQ
jgi:thiamine biosynthesis lipoprotein